MNYLYLGAGIIIGFIIAVVLYKTVIRAGVIHIDDSDNQDRPPLYLELRTDISFLKNHKCVMLDIKTSQK